MKNRMSDLIRVSVIAITALPLLALRRADAPQEESFDWVGGEILPGEPGWAPRVAALLRDAPRA